MNTLAVHVVGVAVELLKADPPEDMEAGALKAVELAVKMLHRADELVAQSEAGDLGEMPPEIKRILKGLAKAIESGDFPGKEGA